MLSRPARVIYLHGFASSPASRKARFFAAELAKLNFAVEVPDLAQGDFEHLTISKQLALLERTAKCEPVILVGSSLGGYLAAVYAASHPEVQRLILLAPAFGFYDLWAKELGPERLEMWRQTGSLPVFHYGVARSMPLAFDLMEDARKFAAFPSFSQPGLIFHGIQDAVVPFQHSVQFAAGHANVRLVEFASGHELTDVLAEMRSASEPFLLAGGGHP
jgi:uncharacterized protein